MIAASFGKMPTTSVRRLICVEPLERVRAVDLRAVRLREAHVRKHIGLNRRRIEKQREIDVSNARYMALQRTTLQECTADIYRGQAELLADTWSEINTALAAMDIPTLSWRHIFVPALEGMRGAFESHSRPALFIGRNPDVPAMENELMGLLL